MIQKKCKAPSCSEMIPRGQQPPYCFVHHKERRNALNKEYDKHRDPEHVAFYKSRRWQRFRRTILMEHHFICSRCGDIGNIVHHEIEVKEDWEKRFDRSNCSVVCHSCHEKIHSSVFPSERA